MSVKSSYYSNAISDFFNDSPDKILGAMTKSSPRDITVEQKNSWKETINIMKDQLNGMKEGRILFEYTIPRMGKRVDVVLLHQNIVFIIEFKCWDNKYSKHTVDQVYSYACDLKDFQKESDGKLLVPIIVPTDAPDHENDIVKDENIIDTLYCNKKTLRNNIDKVANSYDQPSFDYIKWENSEYYPVPTIIEAAQALYANHKVEEITRHDGNIDITAKEIDKIINYSKKNERKSICFITGVPGAGKTLVGLDIAVNYSSAKDGERAIFLSGNGPLVHVLQEALARDRVKQLCENGKKTNKETELELTKGFIQNIHNYRDEYVDESIIPPEHIVIFDEAQRAWNKEKISSFMKKKKGIRNFTYSEPEFLISTMNRQPKWAVVICLIGGGQEIYEGEAGLIEWFYSLKRSFKNWDVYVAPELNDSEYRGNLSWEKMISDLNIIKKKNIHLSNSIRSYRTPDLSLFVKSILDFDEVIATTTYQNIKEKYPMYVTRDLSKAKKWIKHKAKGLSRYGIVASSNGLRLKPDGIFVKNDKNIVYWFLGEKDDVRSSYQMEEVATEFDIQGLEIDYSIVAWDADLRYNNGTWNYYRFRGTKWENIKKETDQKYLKNAYRVLLTRSRQGMIIYVPTGDSEDETRSPSYYNPIYNYLIDIGVELLPDDD